MYTLLANAARIRMLLLGISVATFLSCAPSSAATINSGETVHTTDKPTAKMPIFDSPGCPHCRKVFAGLRDPAITNHLLILDLGEPSNYKVFLREAEQRGETNAWPGHLPVLMTPTTVLRGPEIVSSYLNGNHAVTSMTYAASSASGASTLGGIGRHLFWIGLVDGINPCAFALMIFVCIALRLAGRKGRDVFIAAAVFATAVGGTYLLFGWGLLTGMRHVLVSPMVRAIVYGVSAIACCIGVVLSLVAIVKGGAAAGVPERWRNWLQRGINHKFRLGTGILVIASAGVVASGVEAVCTGQVYLPALLALERERGASLAAFGALLLYNLGFIIPLVAVALGAGLGFRTVQLQNWGAKQVRCANAALATVFVVFAVLLFHWSADEFDGHKMQNARTASIGTNLEENPKSEFLNPKQIQIPNGGVVCSVAVSNLQFSMTNLQFSMTNLQFSMTNLQFAIPPSSPTSLSHSSALARVAAMLPGNTEEPVLCQTHDGDLYWRFRTAGLSVDFWQPIMAQYPEGSIVTNASEVGKLGGCEAMKLQEEIRHEDTSNISNLLASQNSPLEKGARGLSTSPLERGTRGVSSSSSNNQISNVKSQISNNSGSYGEYVAALSWWFAWQRDHGPVAYRRISSGNLLEIVNQACGGCGEATGFRLVTSRFGFKCNPTTTTCNIPPANALPAVITWTSGGIDHAAIFLGIIQSNQAALIRFPAGSVPVHTAGRIHPASKLWLVSL